MQERYSFLILLLLFLILILLAVLIVLEILRRKEANDRDLVNDIENLLDDTEDHITDRVARRVSEIRSEIGEMQKQDAEENRRNRMEISGNILRANESQRNGIAALQKEQRDILAGMDEKLDRRLSGLENMQLHRLNQIQSELSEKLDRGLNERLDQSFKNVGDQLNRLYTSLGELTRLSEDVSSLNRTLSNVKTRGIFGENALEAILADILNPSLYDKNVVTKKSEGQNRDAVEFAVRIPDKEVPGEFMYLPIDSKFPQDVYDRILQASEEADAEKLKKAVKELENRIRQEARDIHEKYLDPPHTTDFAVMFLPTESLYAEVLRIPGLVESLQKTEHIVITGPSTCAAFINTLGIGFRYMAVNRDSRKILKLLSAIKSQYASLSRLIETADNRIDLAKKATREIQHRTEIINKRLSDVEEIDPLEADRMLGFSDENGQN